MVEDDAPTYRALSMILARKGWDVTLAKTLAEATDILMSAPPARIILDLMLPDGNGLTLMQKIKDLRIPSRVVVTTGSHDEICLRAVRELEPAAVLRKPIDLDELMDAMS